MVGMHSSVRKGEQSTGHNAAAAAVTQTATMATTKEQGTIGNGKQKDKKKQQPKKTN